jgi:glycosyltransferase involved in cell wall biosynthesis
MDNAEELKLSNPLLIYQHGDYCLSLCREFKRRGFRLIHICMDYELEIQREHVRESDLTLAIPRAAFDELREEFGDKIRLLPQLSSLDGSDLAEAQNLLEPNELSEIPRPRLGYLGNLVGRVSLPLLSEILSKNPDWHFLSFEATKWLSLPNEHVLSWRSRGELLPILNGLDIGFMPYDCVDPKNLHCVPLKLFDYFACGIPVVSTPITYLREYEDVVYLGATADELADAISLALREPKDSPKKAQRKAIAHEHSIDNLSRHLAKTLAESNL